MCLRQCFRCCSDVKAMSWAVLTFRYLMKAASSISRVLGLNGIRRATIGPSITKPLAVPSAVPAPAIGFTVPEKGQHARAKARICLQSKVRQGFWAVNRMCKSLTLVVDDCVSASASHTGWLLHACHVIVSPICVGRTYQPFLQSLGSSLKRVSQSFVYDRLAWGS